MQNRKLERKHAIEELTRKDILESAVAVLLENSVKKFTMDRVASGAGLAKVAALFLDSINSLMAHRILLTATETIEEDVGELMELFINGLTI